MRCPLIPGRVQAHLACTLSITGAIALIGTAPTLAQITPDTTLGTESSVVNPGAIVQGSPADLIEGGALRGSNVFHSFIDFNVAEAQRVYFANPNGVNNIVSRVTGGNVSNIFGTLGVNGAANLFLLNPNGILFGPNAQLDVAGSFSASTGDRFTYLDGSEFSAVNPNAAPLVTVNITPGVQFGADAPNALILNQGNLAVGQDLSLAAGTVTSSGSLNAGGQVTVEAVSGDAQVQAVTADSALLSARGNLELPQSQIQVAQDLTLQAQDTVQVRDSVDTPVSITAGGDLTIRGEQGIDILALNHPVTPFVSGGDLTLISDGIVSGDAHYASGGNFSILDLAGSPGDFLSLYDPIILSNGNVSFGAYTGPALKVVAGGNINATGDIIINAPETGAAVAGDPDAAVLTGNAALILRAGTNPPSTSTFPINTGGATFTEPGGVGGGNITVAGDILARDTSGSNLPGLVEIIATGGSINTADITAGGSDTTGSITLTTTAGTVVTGNLIAGGGGGGGTVLATVAGDLTVGAIAAGDGAGNGQVTLSANGNNRTIALTGNITARNGDVVINATGTNSVINLGADVAAGTGDVRFNGAVTLTTVADVNGNTITFDGTIAGNVGSEILTLNGNSGVTLGDAAADTITNLVSLSVTGATTLNSGTVTTSGNQDFNSAVTIANNTALTSSGGAITFNGTIAGNAGSETLTLNGNSGVILGDAAADTITNLASLSVTGATTLNSGTVTTSGNQDFNSAVTIANNTALTSSGTLNFQNTLAVNADLTLRASTIGFGGAVTPTGTPTISLEPFDASANLDVANLGTGQLQDGFGAILIGRTDGTGTVNVGTLSFQDPVTIRSSAAGAIAINGPLTGTDDASITLSGPTTLSANVTTAGQNITFNGATTLGAAGLTVSTGAATAGNITFNSTLAGGGNGLTTEAGSGDITFSNPVSGLGALIANSVGTTTFNGTVQATNLTTDAGGTTTLNGDVTTTGAQTYGDAAQLNGDLTLTTTNNGAIAFSNTVDSQASETNNLTVTTGNGAITFNAAVGGATNGSLGTLIVNSTGTTAFNGTVQAASLTTDAGGTTTLNGNVTTTGAQIYGDAVQLNVDLTLTTTNSAVTFSNTVDSQVSETNNLTVTTGNGAVAFNAAVGGAASGELGALAVNTTGTTTFASTVEADSVATNAGGTTVLNGNVTTTGDQTYNDAVTLGADITLAGNDITFNGTLGGAQNLIVNTFDVGGDTGSKTFGDAVADTVTLASLTTNANGTTTLNANVTTTGAQTYNDAAVIVGNDVTLNSNNTAIAFAGTIDSQVGETNDLTINSGTAGTTLNGTIGGTTPLGALTITTGPAIALPTLTVGSLTVDADGVISQQGGSSLTVTGNASFNTQGLLNFGDVNISYSNATLNLGASRIGGDYTLLSGDSASVTRLTQSGAVQVAGLSNFNDSDADGVIDDLSALTNAGNRLFTAPVVDGSGNVIVNQSGDVDLSTDIPQTITGNLIITTVGQLDFVGQLAGGAAVNLTSLTNSFGGTVSVNTDVPAEAVVTARILQSNAINGIAVGGTTTLNAIGGSIQADTLSNNFDSDGSGDGVTLNSATAAIADSGALVLAAVNLTGVSPGGLTVTTGGALTNSGAIAVAGDASLTTTGANADITLNQLNVAGTVTVTTTGTNGDASLTAAGTPADITLGTVSTTGALAVTATGGIALNGGTVTSGGSQTYSHNVTLGTGTTLTSTGGGVTFGGTVNGAQALAISTATGTTLNGSVGNTTALTGLTITGATTVNTAQVITEATAGDQVFNGPVVLGANATFTGNDITFNSTINSDGTARSLTVNSNNGGATTFGGAVGAASALISVTTNGDGTVAINGGSVTTTNNQTYNELLTLGANTTLTSTGGAIAFNNTVNGASDGGQTLTVNGTNGVVFGNDTTDIVGGTNRLAALTVTGATTLNGSAITTTGSQDYNSNVTLGTDVTLTSVGGNVTFDGTLNGARNLTVNTATGTVFNNTVGNTTDLTSLAVTGPTTVNTSQIETTGNQTYSGAVAVNTAATLQSGGTLDFQSALGVNADLVLRATTINFGAAVTPSGSPAIALEPLNAGDNLNVAGLGTNQLQNGFRSITIGRGDGTGVVTVGSIGFQDPVIIQSPGGSVVVNGNLTGTDNASFTFTGPTLIGDGSGTSTITIDTSASSNGAVLFNNAVNAAVAGDSLVVTAGSGGITFSNPVGAGPVLGALTATTTGTIGLSGNVTTTNNQTYNGNVVLGNTITLNSTAGAIALNGNVDATTAGVQGLTVTAATDTTLGDASGDVVGGTEALSNLTVVGAATLNASAVNTTGDQTYNGAVTVVNNAALTSTGGVLDFNNTLATTGNLILTGNEIDFTGVVSTSNASNLTLQPATVSQGISVGNNINNAELNITTGDLNTIQSGFGLLTIGRSDGTGPVTINSSTFNNDVAILGGDITISTNAFIRPIGRNILISGDSVSGQNFTIDPLGLKTGNTAIRARNDIDFTNGLIYGDSLGGGIGGGDVSIISEQGNITLSNQDIISANGGNGAGGNITVRANQGTVTIDAGSRLTTTTQNTGSGGNIAVSGNTLLVAGNSSITSGTGQLFDLSAVGSSNNPGGTGASGDITLTATGSLTLTDSFVSSITRSTAATIAGNISVAGQAITLNNSSITAETSNNVEGSGLVTATGLVGRATQGANITFTGTGLSSLTLSNDSLISARGISPRILPSGLLDAATPNNPTAVAVSDTSVPGGNIFVRGFAQVSGTAAGPRGNDILTSAGGTFGGLIVIDPTVLTGFTIGSGTDFNTLRNNGVNDIASNGEIVTLNLALLFTGPDLEISFVDASGLVGQSCTSASDRSYFRLAGRGGIPSNPTEPLLPSFDQPAWIFLEENGEEEGMPSDPGTILIDQTAQALIDLGECYIQRAEGGATLPWL